MDREKLFKEFNRIALCETRITGVNIPRCTSYILGIVEQLESIIKSSFIPRCCATRYGPLRERHDIAYESVSAHTNLVKALVDRALAYCYDSDFHRTKDGYTYREIMAVIERHDLPENILGDIADNGERPDTELANIERLYQRQFAGFSPMFEEEFERNVSNLYRDYEEKRGHTGKLIYGADKLAAILVTLGYDSIGKSPVLSSAREDASAKEKRAMELCQYREHHVGGPTGEYYLCRASEMWTIDYLKYRELQQYDETGLFTACLIMETLIVNEEWYSWREESYFAL